MCSQILKSKPLGSLKVPWAPLTSNQLFLSQLSVNPRTLNNITFYDIAAFHKSPTVAVNVDELVREAKAQNKYLNISAYATSIKPLRPDLSDIEISIIHSSRGHIPDDVICDMLNITRKRLKHIRTATKPLYHQKDSPIPSLPLVVITDTSRYWSDDELMQDFNFSKEDVPSSYGNTYKELLRSLEEHAKHLSFPVNDSVCSESNNKRAVLNRTTIPSTVLKEDEEDYSELFSSLWTHVSRKEGISNLLSLSDGCPDNLIVNIQYSSKVVNKINKTETRETILKHHHADGGYNPPLVIPKFILKLAISYYNSYVTYYSFKRPPLVHTRVDVYAIKFEGIVPALERIIINLLSSISYTANKLGFKVKPLSSSRGHACSTRKPKTTNSFHLNKGEQLGALGFIADTPPLVYPKFTSQSHGFGFICHDCNVFLSENTTNECKHMKFEVYLHTETGRFKHITYQKPAIYVYSKVKESYFSEFLSLNTSLYYYSKDIYGNIHTILALNLLNLYENYSLPLHKLPFEV